MKIVIPHVTLEWITPNATLVLERIARTCYKSEDKIGEGTAEAMIARLKKNKHGAMLEHASASFRLVIDRGVSHEGVRHRMASFAQESTRYCNYADDKFGSEISVILPPGMTAEQERAWRIGVEAAEKAYLAMLAAGAAPQIARSVLPTCTKTELVITANFREWLHILSLRCDGAAHPQAREIFDVVHADLAKLCPSVFAGEPISI